MIKRNKRFFMILAWGILFFGICLGTAGMPAKAKEQAFIIDAEMLPSNQSAYEVRLTVENQGQDWEGTVRLMISGSYRAMGSCAYDTVLSLPQGSIKQFVIKVPKDSVERTDGMVTVTLLDKNADKVAQKEFDRLLQAEADALSMGILSDEYLSLTYLDMGGNEFYYNGKNYPIRLVELDQDDLADSLDALNYLVIDSYDTSVLPDKALENINKWRDGGGVLILGTGSSAREVLSGFDDLEIQYSMVYAPGEGTYDSDVYASNAYVDLSQLHLAQLRDISGKYEAEYGICALACSWGDGAVGILPYSLAELGELNADDYQGYSQEEFVESILWQMGNHSSFHYGSGKYTYSYDDRYLFNRMCRFMGNGSSSLQFGGLKLIVILYVIFVGPVLYLILRFVKKRDLYWIAVPVAALVGIFLVYLAGRGFEVVSTKVYSVTIENLSAEGNVQTYLRCYDAGHKEWELRFSEGYEYAGPLEESYYRSSDDEEYYYHIRKEGDRLFFGIDPSAGFEDGYFVAGIARDPETGSISGNLKANGQWSISGTVSNGTKRDFKYFAVIMKDNLFVYKNLPAGSEVKLEEAEMVYDNDGGYYDGAEGYFYSFMWDAQREEKKDADILTALGMGISYVYFSEDLNKTVIVGVTEDWDKAVEDKCSEVSYGCLYAVQ